VTATIQARDVAASFGDTHLFAGLDLIVAPGDVVGLVGPNGAGKSTLLRILAGLRPPDAGSVTTSPRSAHLGFLAQEPDARPGESVRAQLGRRTGVIAATATMEAAAQALGEGRDGADEAYSVALESWLPSAAPTSTTGWPSRLDDLGLDRRPGPGDDHALRRPGRPGGPGRAAAVALRRLPARRAHQRPRRRRARPARGVRRRNSTRRASWSATTASSSPAPSRRWSRSTAACSAWRCTAAATTPTCEERSIARRRAQESYEEYAEPQGRACRRGPGCSARGWRRASQRAAQGEATERQDRPQPRGDQREAGGEGRQTERMIERLDAVDGAAQGVEAAVHDRDSATAPAIVVAVARAATVVSAAPSRSARRPATRPARSRRHHGSERAGQDHPAAAAARHRITPTAGSGSLGSGSSWARSTRRGPRSRPTWPCSSAFGREVPRLADRRRAHAAGEVRPGRRPRAPAPPRRCRPANAPARRWRSCRRAGSTCWCSTSPPTTSTCPRSSSWSRRSSVRRHGPAGDARPPHARHGPADPSLGGRQGAVREIAPEDVG
jgi:energy-coupling factor transporter ATP-binding protein EcfA2